MAPRNSAEAPVKGRIVRLHMYNLDRCPFAFGVNFRLDGGKPPAHKAGRSGAGEKFRMAGWPYVGSYWAQSLCMNCQLASRNLAILHMYKVHTRMVGEGTVHWRLESHLLKAVGTLLAR